jgi:NADH-quinone oxidoreductase subunit M
MDMEATHLFDTLAIPLILLLLLGGVALIAVTPADAPNRHRGIAFAVTLLAFLVGILMFAQFDWREAGWQFTFELPWIPPLGRGCCSAWTVLACPCCC